MISECQRYAINIYCFSMELQFIAYKHCSHHLNSYQGVSLVCTLCSSALNMSSTFAIVSHQLLTLWQSRFFNHNTHRPNHKVEDGGGRAESRNHDHYL